MVTSVNWKRSDEHRRRQKGVGETMENGNKRVVAEEKEETEEDGEGEEDEEDEDEEEDAEEDAERAESSNTIGWLSLTTFAWLLPISSTTLKTTTSDTTSAWSASLPPKHESGTPCENCEV